MGKQERLFKLLLVVGVFVTLLSIVFMLQNPIYAIYSSTMGLLLVGFSVFEIVHLRKQQHTPQTPATQTKRPTTIAKTVTPTKKQTAQQPTVAKKPLPKKGKGKSKTVAILLSVFLGYFGVDRFYLGHTGTGILKLVTFAGFGVWYMIDLILIITGKLKPKKGAYDQIPVVSQTKRPTTIAKTVTPTKKQTAQQQQVRKPVMSNKQASKQAILRDYVYKSYAAHIPKEKIIEAAIAAEWPPKMVMDVINAKEKQRSKKKLFFLSIVGAIGALILFLLLITGNLLFGYWVQLLSGGSSQAYLITLLAIIILILFFAIRLKMLVKKKKRIYHFVEEKKLSDYKKTLDKQVHKPVASGGFQTDIDKLYNLVLEKESITLSEVAKTFGINKVEAEEWGKILKDQDLITIHYPTVGELELQCKKTVKEDQES